MPTDRAQTAMSCYGPARLFILKALTGQKGEYFSNMDNPVMDNEPGIRLAGVAGIFAVRVIREIQLNCGEGPGA